MHRRLQSLMGMNHRSNDYAIWRFKCSVMDGDGDGKYPRWAFSNWMESLLNLLQLEFRRWWWQVIFPTANGSFCILLALVDHCYYRRGLACDRNKWPSCNLHQKNVSIQLVTTHREHCITFLCIPIGWQWCCSPISGSLRHHNRLCWSDL